MRAKQTVEAVLDAVARVLKRDGPTRVTTNRIAEVAGVSVGSLYQYFPDKRAIFVALRDRHVAEMARLIEHRFVQNAAVSLDALVRALMEAVIDAHALDPVLFDLLLSQVPPGTDEPPHLESGLQGAVRLALAARASELELSTREPTVVFVVTQMVEALAHAVVLRRPAPMSLSAATEEAVRAVVSYVGSHRRRRRQERGPAPTQAEPRAGRRTTRR